METNKEKQREITRKIDSWNENENDSVISISCISEKVHIAYAGVDHVMAETIATCMVNNANFKSIMTAAVAMFMAHVNSPQYQAEQLLNEIINTNKKENGTN